MKFRILIIDSEPRWREFVKGELNDYEISLVKDVNEAFKSLSEKSFNMIVASSISLEDLGQIKIRYPDVKIIVVTVHPKIEERLQAYRLGAVRYLTKSFRNHALVEYVDELLPAISGSS